MIDPGNPIHYNRLCKSIQYSRSRLATFREMRLKFIRRFLGANYSNDGSQEKAPINFLELAINIYKRYLASTQPRVLARSNQPGMKSQTGLLELALNHLLREIEYGQTLDAVVMDALFSIGIAKVGVTGGPAIELDGFLHETGQPFADPIELDDWCHDMTAKRWEAIGYCGNMYWEDYQSAKEKYGDRVKPMRPMDVDEQGNQRVSALSSSGTGPTADGVGYEETCLWDMWLVREKKMLVMAAGDDGLPFGQSPLRVVDWDGPEYGPFHILSFNRVPGNIMPLSPASLLYDLNDLANRLFVKMGRQADRQKTNPVFRKGNDPDANRMREAADGEFIPLDDPQSVKEVRQGGVDAGNVAFSVQLRDLFVYLAGNLDVLGGLSPQAETLGQEEMLKSGASQRMLDMHDRTSFFNKRVCESLSDYLWYDPTVDLPLIKRFPGVDIDIPIRFNRDVREGDFLDMELEIVPFSTYVRTPAERLQTVMQTLERLVIPLAPQLEAQGLTPDMPAVLELIARYSGVPEVQDIMRKGQAQQAGGERSPAPQTVNRNTTRRNVPMATRGNRDTALVQAMAAIPRNTGGNGQSGG